MTRTYVLYLQWSARILEGDDWLGVLTGGGIQEAPRWNQMGVIGTPKWSGVCRRGGVLLARIRSSVTSSIQRGHQSSI